MWSQALSEAENLRVFGKCANPSGHGHRYRIEITVAAEVTNEKPYVIERAEINRLIREVLSPRFLNQDLDTTFGPGFISSGENVAKAVWDLIMSELDARISLISVKIVETHKNAFVYKGEDGSPQNGVPRE
jgi:6-pyruvoyltetrahydropterin/6-carboxytetrahydropterin synthase